jgi:hypothetical protein
MLHPMHALRALPTAARSALVTAVAVCAAACGAENTPAAAVDAVDAVEDVVQGCQLPGSSYVAGPAVGAEDFAFEIKHLGGSFTVKGELHVPTTCNKVTPCPLIVVVGDRDTSPLPDWSDGAERLASSTESLVAVWNLPGTGVGGHKSGGVDDYGGDVAAIAVKEVMNRLAAKSAVDKPRSGFLTVGFGLVPTAAALAKFSLSTLSFVAFLVDVEGPSDRCAISQAPENAALSIGPNDGPGVSESACTFSAEASHAKAYPVGSGDVPTSIVCAPGAWPITETGKNCTDETWWARREPSRQLAANAIEVRYQRIAFEIDHRMPSRHATGVMLKALAESRSPWFTVNDMPPCNQPLSDAQCETLAASCQRCWLSYGFGNGMSPGLYAPKGTLAEITPDELLGDVAPRFVKRIMDVAGNPACPN